MVALVSHTSICNLKTVQEIDLLKLRRDVHNWLTRLTIERQKEIGHVTTMAAMFQSGSDTLGKKGHNFDKKSTCVLA